eukprot:gnl/Dysnectes_brevis/8278_a14589_225.p1 GENE.gnl/Dysnectes_brevis/8278_a14589_225~~gnl/Dysnectes_brevis/8278_a14589_225.p1  ORF type:complete len:351 (+),score=12.74 gnl/Dysnectes_brevis/8278_a14589_225:52-1104(+)
MIDSSGGHLLFIIVIFIPNNMSQSPDVGKLASTISRAIRSFKSHPVHFKTESLFITEHDVTFELLERDSLIKRKIKDLKAQGTDPDGLRNVFKDKDCFPIDTIISPSSTSTSRSSDDTPSQAHYALVRNKFSVLDRHLLLVTIPFIHQQTLISHSEFILISSALHSASVFFNGGAHSGGSQPRKHFHVIPDSCEMPLESLIPHTQMSGHIPILGDHTATYYTRFPHSDAPPSAVQLMDAYKEGLLALHLSVTPFPVSRDQWPHTLVGEIDIDTLDDRQHDATVRRHLVLQSYSLIVSRSLLVMIRRRNSHPFGVGLNAMSYSGRLFIARAGALSGGVIRAMREGIIGDES